jgi:hypothetical protein
MNLDEFIIQALQNGTYNAYVDEPGFDTLYVRVAKRYIDNVYIQTIDLANIIASNPGEGMFSKLVIKLRNKYPDLTIFVECVLTSRFANKLISMGFVEVKNQPSNFYYVG